MNAATWARDLRDGRVLRLALPAVGSAMVLLVHRAIDMAWVRGLGTEATAALTVSTVSVWIQHALGILLAVGLTALVARYAGAGREQGAGYIASQGLRQALVLGVCVAPVAALGHLVFVVTDAAPEVARQGLPYVQLTWIGSAALMVPFAGDAIFRAHGNTRTPLFIACASLAFNAVVDPLLIYGVGPIPALGVAGAGLATVLASLLATGLHLRCLRRAGHLHRARPDDAELRLRPTTPLGQPRWLGLDAVVARRTLKVGVPAALSSLLFNGIYLWILRIVGHAGGDAAQAGLGVGHTGEGVAYVMGLGWSAAAAALVGRALGKDAPRQAWRHARVAARQCLVWSTLWAVLLFLLAEPLALWLARDVPAQAHAVSYFRVLAFFLLPQAVDLVLTGAFGGAGHTLPPTIINLVFAFARVPLAWWVGLHLGHGVIGIWWVIAGTTAARAALVILWWRRGTWTTREV